MEAASFGQGLKRLRRKEKRTQTNGTTTAKGPLFFAEGVLLSHEEHNFHFKFFTLRF
jgi:hypothetical protein